MLIWSLFGVIIISTLEPKWVLVCTGFLSWSLVAFHVLLIGLCHHLRGSVVFLYLEASFETALL